MAETAELDLLASSLVSQPEDPVGFMCTSIVNTSVRSPLTSPLSNRLSKNGQGEQPLTQEESAHISASITQLLKHLKRGDSSVVQGILSAVTADIGQSAVTESCEKYLAKKNLKRAPSMANARRVKTICVTNVHSFLYGHIVASFLRQGFTVVGLVPDHKTLAKVKHLQSLDNSEHLTLEVCDLKGPGLMKVFSGVDTIIHSAWPLTKPGRTEQEIAEKSLKTMSKVMQCAIDASSVRHVVITSSTAAVRLFSLLEDPARGYSGDEWSDETKLRENKLTSALALLQTEQLAWELYSNHVASGASNKIKLSSICVGQAVGPSIDKTIDPSSQRIADLVSGKMTTIPQDYVQYVDVRDAARAHVASAQMVAQGRVVCVGGVSSYETICKELSTIAPEGIFPNKLEERDLPPPEHFDVSECESLGVEFRPLKATLTDIVAEMKAKAMI